VFSLLNTTFFAAMFGLTYLAVDPLVKAVYLLRCFYGDSLKSGEDVRGELKQMAALAQGAPVRLAAIVLLVLAATTPTTAGLINTPLQRGVRPVQRSENRFNGFPGARETVETASEAMAGKLTPLQRGFNERLGMPGLRQPKFQGFGAAPADVSARLQGISAPEGQTTIAQRFSVGFGTIEGQVPATVAESASESVPFLGGAVAGSQAVDSVPPEELDKAIRETIKKRKYAWRMPRDKAPEAPAEQSILSRFFEKVGEMLQRGLKAVGRWLDNFLRGLFQGQSRTKTGSSGYNWVATLQMLAYLLIAVAVGAALLLLFRYWRGGRLGLTSVSSTPIEPAPDLNDENVGADQLPEDGWIRLGRELFEQGEFRLALRAFYLASLAHLAERNLVSLAKFKSNRDYQRELQRRAHAFPEVALVFGENVGVFDRVWYGMHAVDGDVVNQFAANVERLKGGPA
jgi:hypothetical protein